MKYFILIALCFFLKSQAAKTAFFEDIYSKKLVLCRKTKEISSDKFVDNIIYYKKNNFYYKRIYKHLTPEMFGAKGDGVSDDYKAIQEMLDKGEEGCIFYFDGKKTYYNAFANKGLWIEPLKRNIWQRRNGAKFLFNGAKFRRRLAEWNDQNTKSDYNTGRYYTDDHTALLYLTGNNYTIDKADFNSNVPITNLLDEDGKITNIRDYAVGSCLEMGLWLENCNNITITNSTFSNSVFPIFVENSTNLTLENVNLRYAAQAGKRIHSKDQALGGGIKLIKSKNVNLINVNGYRNLNDTVEIETLNSQITVNGKSENDYANSLVIISSEDIKLDWEAKNIINGSGVLIKSSDPNEIGTKNISGKIKIDNASWCGVLIWLDKSSSNNLDNISLQIDTNNTGYTGLFVNNESEQKIISKVKIDHTSGNDGMYSGFTRLFNNTIEGNVNGTNKDSSRIAAKATGTTKLNTNSPLLNFSFTSKENQKLRYEIEKDFKATIKQ